VPKAVQEGVGVAVWLEVDITPELVQVGANFKIKGYYYILKRTVKAVGAHLSKTGGPFINSQILILIIL
jgi:hypothetical protein